MEENSVIDTQKRIDRFNAVLERLASSATDQREYIDGLGLAPMLDELALEFEDLYLPLGQILDSLRNGAVISRECSEISAALASPTLGWVFDDLASEEWAAIRVRAARTSELLSTSLGMSPLD